MNAAMTARRRVPTVHTEAEVRLDKFDEEEIIQYLQDLGYHVRKTSDTPVALPEAEQVYYAFQRNDPRAPTLARELVADIVGRIP